MCQKKNFMMSLFEFVAIFLCKTVVDTEPIGR